MQSTEKSLQRLEQELRRVASLPGIAGGAPMSAEFLLSRIVDVVAGWSPAAGVSDHGALTGNADDDHTQYIKEKASGGLAAELPEHTHAEAAEGGLVSVHIRKEANETVNNSDILQNDDHLFMDLAANEEWAFEAYLIIIGSSTADIKCAFTVPAGATLHWSYHPDWSEADAFSLSTGVTVSGTARRIGVTTNTRGVFIKGYVLNGANAGSLQLQWAQNSQTVADTIVNKGSYLLASKLA